MNVRLDPYLTFNGNCREAMDFYKDIFGGKLDIQTYGESPINSDDSTKDRIMHAMLESGDITFMASDSMSAHPVFFGSSMSLTLNGNDKEKLEKYFELLSEGGEVSMPLGEAFWGDIYGAFKDKFGVHWMVNISRLRD